MKNWEHIGRFSPHCRGMAPRVACDAMCGGLARWLRLLGVDAAYVPGIEDRELVELALRENRCVISSDRRLFLRRVFHTGELHGLYLRPGLRRMEQVRSVFEALRLEPGPPRCSRCGGILHPVERGEVADRVPARSLIWASQFQECEGCGNLFWRGTHWRRIDEVRRWLGTPRRAS